MNHGLNKIWLDVRFSLNEVSKLSRITSFILKTMNKELVDIKDELAHLNDEYAMEVFPLLKMLVPAIDEVTTEEAYQIFGSRREFDQHRREGNIHPVRGFSRKSRKFWSRAEIYNLKQAERIIMKVV